MTKFLVPTILILFLLLVLCFSLLLLSFRGQTKLRKEIQKLSVRADRKQNFDESNFNVLDKRLSRLEKKNRKKKNSSR